MCEYSLRVSDVHHNADGALFTICLPNLIFVWVLQMRTNLG